MSNLLNEKILSIADLLPDEYSTCVQDALRDAVVSWFHNLSNDDKARIISNMSYQMMYDIIKKEMPDVENDIKNAVVEKIKNEKNYSFYIFGYENLYRNDSPKAGQKIIDQTIRDNAELIRTKTEESIVELSKKDIKQFMVNFQYKMK